MDISSGDQDSFVKYVKFLSNGIYCCCTYSIMLLHNSLRPHNSYINL